MFLVIPLHSDHSLAREVDLQRNRPVNRRITKFRAFLGPEVWRLFLLAIVVGLLWFAVESSFAYVLQGFLSTLGLIPKVNLGKVAQFYPTSVIGSVAMLICFGLFRSTVIFLRYHTANVTSQAFIRSQRSKILKYTLENAAESNTTDAVTLFNDRVTESGRVIQNFVSIVNLTTAIVLFSVLCLWLTPIEFVIGMFVLAVALAPIRRLNKIVGTASAGIVDESRQVTNSLLVGLRNNFLLRIYGEVQPVVRLGDASLARYEAHFRRYSRVYCLNGSFPHFVGVLAVSIVTFVSLNYLKTPSSALLAFFYLFFRIAQSASETSALLNEARVYFASMGELMKFSTRVSKSSAAAQGKGTPVGDLQNIEFQNLSFAWPSGVEVMSDLSASVARGQLLLIKGESGSGKSTLLSLMSGLLQPSKGDVLINGLSITQVDRPSLSEQIGYVGPDSFMIEGTLRENLLFAHSRPDSVPDDELLKAVRLVHLDTDFAKAEIGLSTHFNEFTQLSTGQKQRLALARALLRKPSVLILDEATANLDSETEAKLIASLHDLRTSMITIAVSHRPAFDTIASSKIEMGAQ